MWMHGWSVVFFPCQPDNITTKNLSVQRNIYDGLEFRYTAPALQATPMLLFFQHWHQHQSENTGPTVHP